jgi:hypothetical protein
VWDWDITCEGLDGDDSDEDVGGDEADEECCEIVAATAGAARFNVDFTKRYDVDFGESQSDSESSDVVSISGSDSGEGGDENRAPDSARITTAEYNNLVVAMQSLSKRRLAPSPPGRDDVIVISDSDE